MSITEFDVTGILLERVLLAIENLSALVANQPPVQVPPVDLGEIVTAVNGLRPGVTAEEIAAAIGRVIQPSAAAVDTSPQLEKMAGVLEQVEYRLRAPGQVVGGGVMNLPANLQVNNSLRVVESNLSGTWGYNAGVSGSPTLPAGAKILGITAHATTAGSMTINGGDSIPVPANSAIAFAPVGTLVTPALVFTGTDAYAVEYTT